MKRRDFVMLLALAISGSGAMPAIAAQRTPVVPAIDPELEKLSNHNLEVARLYFKKKAWKGVAGRLEEVVATYPEYTRIDEVYYLLGVAYVKVERVNAARDMFKALLDARPESDFAKRAREELAELDKQVNP